MLKKAEKELFTIGEVAKICKISKKTLRFYDQLGVIKPDHVCPENGYRYYSRHTLLAVPIVKYYKQMGFKLNEMGDVVDCESYYYHENNFKSKLEELAKEEQKIHDSIVATRDWYELLQEGRIVVQNQLDAIGVKYMDTGLYCYQEQKFSYDYMESIINIPWVNYLGSMEHEITGPVILKFLSYQEKMRGKCAKTQIMQKSIHPLAEGVQECEMQRQMVASKYYVGPLDQIDIEYQKIQTWAGEHHFKLSGEAYERYVVDYWTTCDPQLFVTELILPICQ